jgi:hypothetical protein
LPRRTSKQLRSAARLDGPVTGTSPPARSVWPFRPGVPVRLKEAFDRLVQRLVPAAHKTYGDRLVSVVLYGSVARGTMRHDSDIDLLIVARIFQQAV